MMVDKNIKRKLQIFISSRCGNKYSVARKALGFMLESTGLADVYVYENELASSEDNISAYLKEVDRSDLVVFLVDNKDGPSDPVISEQQRAKANGLRLIYIFCDEENRDPTQMQIEVRNSASEKYFVTHEFSEMAQVAYMSVMQDLITIYKNSHVDGKIDTVDISSISSVENKGFYILDRKSFPGGRTIAREISRRILYMYEEEQSQTAFDEGALALLWHVLGKQRFSTESFDLLKEQILSCHTGTIKEIIDIRADAMKAFYSGELDRSIILIKEALEKGVGTTDVPHWLLMDIAVDLRYVLNMQLQKGNRYNPENEGQKFITDSKEALYYPLLDRREKEMHELLSGYYFKIANNAPGSVHIGGVDAIISPLGDICALAIVYGSIIQLQMMKDRVISILFSLCQLYQNHKWAVEMISLLVIDRSNKDLEAYTRTQNSTEHLLNQDDVEKIWDAVNTIPYAYQKMHSKYLLMQHFGYYASNDGFATMSGELISYSTEWLDDPERYYYLGKPIADFYKENAYRIAPQYTVKYIERIFEKKIVDLYGDAIALVYDVMNNKPILDVEKRILSILVKAIAEVKEEKLSHHISRIHTSILHFALNASIDLIPLEDALRKYDLEFFNSMYSMEILAKDAESMEPHLRNEIDSIHTRNEKQGRNGVHYGFATDPLGTVKNIVSHSDATLTDDIAKDIILAAIETLAAPQQTSNDKVSAIKLLMWMYSKWKEPFETCTTYESLVAQINIHTNGKEGWFEAGSNESIKFAYLLLLQKMNPLHTEDIIESILSVEMDDNDQVIATLEIINDYLICYKGQELGEMAMVLLSICVTASRHRERTIKHLAARCLIALTHYEATQKYALRHLSLLLDQGTPVLKTTIISRINQMNCDDQAIVDYMLQKASVDNHYLVRMVAKREDGKKNINIKS